MTTTSPGGFKDHFSAHASAYARARPHYPAALFAAIAAQCANRERCWDCATGNGQAANALADHFQRVVATDASRAQIGSAAGPVNVEFRVATAEASGLESGSVDLVTVAQALHWFDVDAFFAEAGRVLRPGGVLAYWCYGNCDIEDGLGEWVQAIYAAVDDYWPPERVLIERGYRDIQAPFPRLELPTFEMRSDWTAEELLAYVATWSACQRYREATGADPLADWAGRVTARWGAGRRTVRWPLFVTACRLPGSTA